MFDELFDDLSLWHALRVNDARDALNQEREHYSVLRGLQACCLPWERERYLEIESWLRATELVLAAHEYKLWCILNYLDYGAPILYELIPGLRC